MAKVDLEFPNAGALRQLECKAHDLHVRLNAAVAQELPAGLQNLARPPAFPRGILPEHVARIADAQRRRAVRQLCRREPRRAGGEVVAQRQKLAVEVEESNQLVGHVGAACPHEHFSVLERGRNDFLVARGFEPLHHLVL